MDDYNHLVGSFESRLLPSARKMHQDEVGTKELDPITPMELTVRELNPRTLRGLSSSGAEVARLSRERNFTDEEMQNAIPMTVNDDDDGAVIDWPFDPGEQPA